LEGRQVYGILTLFKECFSSDARKQSGLWYLQVGLTV